MINDEIHPSCWNFTYGNWRIQEFYSPNFPGEYATDVDCVQYLQAPPGFKIQLHFDSIFAVEKSHECQFDYLEIRDGPFAYSPLIGRYCSLEFPPLVTSTGRYLWLRFKSDDVLQYTGFKAVYSYHKDNTQNDAAVVNKVESYPACYFHLRLGLDKSFDYFTTADLSGEEELELPKGAPVDCTWEIFTERGYSIYLNGQDIRLNHTKGCHRNNITVFDRTTLDKDIKVDVCKDNVDKFEYSSDSNRIFVRVYTESIKHKPSFRIKYLLTRKGQCNRESERKCGSHCVPLKHVCKVAELCKDVTETERCAVKTGFSDGPRKNIYGGNTEKKREEKLEETKEGMGLSQLYVIILGAVGGFILTCVVVGLCIMCHLRKRGRGKRQDSNATAVAAAASHKSPQRNALEIAVCNSSNTSMSLSRQNEISGNRQGGLDRQHYVAFGRMNSPAPNNAMVDNSHRYSITDHHLQGPEGERIPDVMTESGNYKRFLTMEMTPDDIMIEQGVYPGTPTGVMGVTNLDHRMPDIYGNYHGNMWHPKDDNVYPYGSASLTRPTPFLGMSKTFSYTQPESKYEIKYLKTMKPVDNDALKEHQAA
ncbi:neuropilin and tolloid-like protein 2 isoform X2 [Biomphalaria glabrata]|uniref:Neuropilin and tolloid-like protein 2 isoform X2 n=1 Tax=Biomphalaria glabrata TaxID=6526 RepID=A0A9W3AY45_BIOGL|nr:neuropilin and tolloid-like protein 2 isoform X2 [Biomphalaria glabrata]